MFDHNDFMEERREFEDFVFNSILNAFGPTAEVMRDYQVEIGNGLKRVVDVVVRMENRVYLTEIYTLRERHTLSWMQITDRIQRLFTYATLSYQTQHSQFTLYPLIVLNIINDDSTERDFRSSRRKERLINELSAIISIYGVEDDSKILIDIEDLKSPNTLREKFENAPEIWRNLGRTFTTQKKKHDVFISYRRTDTQWAAGRIADFLKVIFNPADIFFDTRNIDLGDNFVDAIRNQINASNVLIAVIGYQWLTVAHSESGIRRLDDEDDYVWLEIATALSNNLIVIPILIDDTEMPNQKYLPDDLKPLAMRNAGRISAKSFHSDIAPLVQRLDDLAVPKNFP